MQNEYIQVINQSSELFIYVMCRPNCSSQFTHSFLFIKIAIVAQGYANAIINYVSSHKDAASEPTKQRVRTVNSQKLFVCSFGDGKRRRKKIKLCAVIYHIVLVVYSALDVHVITRAIDTVRIQIQASCHPRESDSYHISFRFSHLWVVHWREFEGSIISPSCCSRCQLADW